MLTFIHTLKELLSVLSEQNSPRRFVMGLFFDVILLWSVMCCIFISHFPLPLYLVFFCSLAKRQRQHATIEHFTKLCWCWGVLLSLIETFALVMPTSKEVKIIDRYVISYFADNFLSPTRKSTLVHSTSKIGSKSLAVRKDFLNCITEFRGTGFRDNGVRGSVIGPNLHLLEGVEMR